MAKILFCSYCKKKRYTKNNKSELLQDIFDWEKKHEQCVISHYVFKVTMNMRGGEVNVKCN